MQFLNKPWIPSRSWLYSYYVPKFPTRIQLLTFYLCLFFAYNPSSKKEKTFYIPSFTLSESKFIIFDITFYTRNVIWLRQIQSEQFKQSNFQFQKC